MPEVIGLVDFDGCGDADRGLNTWFRNFLPFATTAASPWGGFGIQIGIDPFNGKGFARREFTPQAHPIIGHHFNVESESDFAERPIIQFGHVNGTVAHIVLDVSTDERLRILSHTGSVLLQTAAGFWDYNFFYYMETELIVASSGGRVRILIGNEEILNFSGATKNPAADGVVSSVHFANGESQNIWIDDLIIVDANVPGAIFPGVIQIGERHPAADGAHSDFVPSTGTQHFALVDELPFSEADYNSTSTDGARDSYTVHEDGITFEPAAVRSLARWQATATPAAVRAFLKDGSNYGLGVIRHPGAVSFFSDIYGRRPDNTPWTSSSVDAVEVGGEKVSL